MAGGPALSVCSARLRFRERLIGGLARNRARLHPQLVDVGAPQPRFEIHATGPKGERLRFWRDSAAKAVERALELAKLGLADVVIIDPVDGLRYRPPEFETLLAASRHAQGETTSPVRRLK